jgi:hypothetical protein
MGAVVGTAEHASCKHGDARRLCPPYDAALYVALLYLALEYSVTKLAHSHYASGIKVAANFA